MKLTERIREALIPGNEVDYEAILEAVLVELESEPEPEQAELADEDKTNVEDARTTYMRGFNDAAKPVSDAACEAFMAGYDDEASSLRAVYERLEANYDAPRPGRPE